MEDYYINSIYIIIIHEDFYGNIFYNYLKSINLLQRNY